MSILRLLRFAPAVGAVTAAHALLACSGVPDIRFVADDAGTGADASPGDGAVEGSTDAGKDAKPVGDGATGQCPQIAPEGGVCCGALACEGCAATDCADCVAKGCATNEVCCARGASVRCTEPGKCQ